MEKRWSRQEGGKSFGFNLLFSKMYVGLTLKIIFSHSNLPIVMTQINKALGFNHLLTEMFYMVGLIRPPKNHRS